jgi:hypothetical protein
MALSDAAIRSAKPRPKAYKLYDTDGLFVIVRPSGGKLWRLKYRHLGKEQQLSLGVFPAVGLKEARRKRDDARTLIDRGQSPALEKRRRRGWSARPTPSRRLPRSTSPSASGRG